MAAELLCVATSFLWGSRRYKRTTNTHTAPLHQLVTASPGFISIVRLCPQSWSPVCLHPWWEVVHQALWVLTDATCGCWHREALPPSFSSWQCWVLKAAWWEVDSKSFTCSESNKLGKARFLLRVQHLHLWPRWLFCLVKTKHGRKCLFSVRSVLNMFHL